MIQRDISTPPSHPHYLEHRCKILKDIRKSDYYNGEMIYKMHKATQWYFSMVSDLAQSFNTPIYFCPYCGNKLPIDTPVSTETTL